MTANAPASPHQCHGRPVTKWANRPITAAVPKEARTLKINALNDLVYNLRREHRRANKPMDERAALVPYEPTESQCCHVRLAGPGRLKLGPEGGDQQHWKALDLFQREIEQLA